jgi:transposase InsO family protein
MKTHPRAKLGLAGRRELCRLIEAGASQRAAAGALGVSPATANKWWRRWRAASEQDRRSLACLRDRPCRPHSSPRMLPAAARERICEVRRHTGWGPRLIAGAVGLPHSTVHRTLRRHGISRPPRRRREEPRRYLLHMDTERYARFGRPGHRMTGVRDKTHAELSARWGHEFAHSIVDDHSRLAYAELHRDERAATVVAFTRRALAFFAAHGIEPRRPMTDNAWCYTNSRRLARLLGERGIRHLTIAPHRPQTNGKVERFQQTMAREWAYGMTYRSSDDRARALPHWLDYYNRSRPHSGIGGRPPISRVHEVPG